MLKKFIAKVAEGQDLHEGEAQQAMAHIMEGEGLPTQIASFLTALRMKGETIEEITGFARTMRARAVRIRAHGPGMRGGHLRNRGRWSWNFQHLHGRGPCCRWRRVDRGQTRKPVGFQSKRERGCPGSTGGSTLPFIRKEWKLPCKSTGLAFLFAPSFHPAMKHAVGPRREIGIRTAFNLLGPLTNPAGATVHLLGVYRRDLTRPVAEVLKSLGSKAAFVVHGTDHSDEISITGGTAISRLKDGAIEDYRVEPEDAGLKRAKLEEIRGGKPEENAQMIKKILEGEAGPRRDVVLLNAAAVFVASRKVSDLKEGVEMARESIDSGKARNKLKELVRFSNTAS